MPKKSFLDGRYGSFAVFLIFAILLTCIYSNSFEAPFIFDDIGNIVEKQTVHLSTLNYENIKKAVFEGANENRWIPNFTLALNYYFGGLNPVGYHVVNLVIHILVSCIIYNLFHITLTQPLFNLPLKRSAEISLIAALLWAVHPLQTNAVTYTVQRMTSLAALFYLSSLLFYIKGRLSPQRPLGRKSFFILSAFFGMAAFLCKENSFVLPFVVLLYDFYFLQEDRSTLNLRKFAVHALFAVLVILGVTVFFLGIDFFTKVLSGFSSRDFTLGERLLTESRIIFWYLSLMILPLPTRLNLCYDYPISTSIMAPPQTLLSVVGIFFLLMMVLLLCRNYRLYSFTLLWFLVNLVIESTFVPLELIFEHRLYLPSIFLFLACMSFLYTKFDDHIKIVRMAALVIIIILSIFTWQRNDVLADDVALWQDVLVKSPGLPRGYENLSSTYIEKGMFNEAFDICEKASLSGHKSVILYNNWGAAAIKIGKVDFAVKILEQSVKMDFNDGGSHYNLGLAYAKQGRKDKARRHMMLGMQLLQSVR